MSVRKTWNERVSLLEEAAEEWEEAMDHLNSCCTLLNRAQFGPLGDSFTDAMLVLGDLQNSIKSSLDEWHLRRDEEHAAIQEALTADTDEHTVFPWIEPGPYPSPCCGKQSDYVSNYARRCPCGNVWRT